MFGCAGVFVAVRSHSLVSVSRAYSLLQCLVLSLWRLVLLWRRALGATGFSELSSHGTRPWSLWSMWNLPGPGIELCPLHWQVDSYPRYHWEVPQNIYFNLSGKTFSFTFRPSFQMSERHLSIHLCAGPGKLQWTAQTGFLTAGQQRGQSRKLDYTGAKACFFFSNEPRHCPLSHVVHLF